MLLLLGIHHVVGQDDAGADLDMESMLGDTGGGGEMGSEGESGKVLTQIQQTTRALQQLGVILSINYMINFLTIWTEQGHTQILHNVLLLFRLNFGLNKCILA